MLSLHVDGANSARPHGLAAYYYGGGESSSTIGERLADLVQRELVARTGLLDGRIHGKTWAMLRLTRMPAVRVELGYLTSPIDRPMLIDPRFRDTVAEGLLVAVQRLYLPVDDDPPTGVMRIPRRHRRVSARQRGSASTPSSRSSAYSTSSFHVTVVLMSSRSRGVRGCGRTVLNPTASR